MDRTEYKLLVARVNKKSPPTTESKLQRNKIESKSKRVTSTTFLVFLTSASVPTAQRRIQDPQLSLLLSTNKIQLNI